MLIGLEGPLNELEPRLDKVVMLARLVMNRGEVTLLAASVSETPW